MKKTLVLLGILTLILFQFGCSDVEEKLSEKVNPRVINEAKNKAENQLKKLQNRVIDRVNNKLKASVIIEYKPNFIYNVPVTMHGKKYDCPTRQFDYKNDTYHVMVLFNGLSYAIQKKGDDKAIICRIYRQPSEEVMYNDTLLIDKLYNGYYDILNTKGKNYKGKHPEVRFIEGGIIQNNIPKYFVTYQYKHRLNKFIPIKDKKEIVFEWNNIEYIDKIENSKTIQ